MTRLSFLMVLAALTASMPGLSRPALGAEQATPVKITLHPMAEPTPALKYRLLPGFMEQQPGNAAVHYGKVTAEEIRFFSSQEIRDNIDRWQETPLDDLRRDQAYLPSGGSIEDSLRRGALCKYCDWQLPIGEEPYYTMLLPEAQQTRGFGRIMAVRARLQIRDGEVEKAIQSFQTGYTLGQHAAAGETLVSGLVGIAICEIISRQVFDYVQQPDAPNLYWALTNLPSPLIQIDDALDVESVGFELTYPELRDLASAERSPEQWSELFHRIAKEGLELLSDKSSPEPPTPEQLDERCREMLPTAQQALIASGLPANEVESMSIHQVALLYSLLVYHEKYDGAIKYFQLPYPQAIAGIEGAIERAKLEPPEIIPISERLLQSIPIIRSAMARTDRRIAVLRILEALRIHAAGHQGKLPNSLADIVEVPIPDDPVTGKPFVYRLDGDTAFLQGPTFRDTPVDYEITMARSY